MRPRVVVGITLLLALSVMADEFPMRPSSIVPGATATVHANTDRNGNVAIVIDAKHLAPPDRLTPQHTSYIVWTQSQSGTLQKAGVLRVNSADEAASFKSSVPYHNFDIWITAEDSNNVTTPTGPEILRATVGK